MIRNGKVVHLYRVSAFPYNVLDHKFCNIRMRRVELFPIISGSHTVKSSEIQSASRQNFLVIPRHSCIKTAPEPETAVNTVWVIPPC
jgi:hypothetical protein